MRPTGGDVAEFLAAVTPAKRRNDGIALAGLLREVTATEPELWGSIVGFGRCHYRYPTGTEGDAPVLGFAPRKVATTLYLLDGVGPHRAALERLGPHTTGAGCLYLRDLDAVDRPVLRGILESSLAVVRSGGGDAARFTIDR